jgi:hypothetical protein
MQIQINPLPRPTQLEKKFGVKLPAQPEHRPQPKAFELVLALASRAPLSFYHNVIPPKSGVPFSPLND